MNKGILEARVPPEEVVRKYNRIASIYDLFGYLMESKARRRALDFASIKNGEKVLEVAVGTGLNFVEILKRNPSGRVEGIDISIKMLEKAHRRAAKMGFENYRLYLCDCRQLPFEEDVFDILMNQYLFDILPLSDFFTVLFEFKRVLKAGGRIVLVNMTKGVRRVNQIYEEIYKLKPPLLAGSRGVFLSPYLRALGFKDIRREFVSQWGFPSEVVYAVKQDGSDQCCRVP